ncbi:hypothetical protein FE257_010973 [Aspergillus nanangensis]|uniref:Zn(2)-C6 fungal-type domain-containing protein n=1 Tax=Aspergillus nanangensis TaxID=2582783 RepID=A0AAD4CI03_ASPNN|nr:hypothetical protein FE257_010973 [Aspergillus nanangensis]
MSPQPTTNGPSDDYSDPLETNKEKVPACQSCRRKKAKCDREQPCSQCTKFNLICLYDNGRLKPGLRAGAVEQLQRRVETLENMFIGQGVLWQKVWDAVNTSSSGTHGQSSSMERDPTDLAQVHDQVKDSLLELACEGGQSSPGEEVRHNGVENEGNGAGGDDDDDDDGLADRSPKRRRIEPKTSAHAHPWMNNNDQGLPPGDVVDELVEFYFANVHHWIPILHVKRFRQRVQTPEGRAKSIHILHAIVATCVRFTNHPGAGDEEAKTQMAAASRQTVILNSMESFSVENLQALVILAFDTIGSGRGPSAWSIVGSMTRTVEQLQLSVEEAAVGETRTTEGEFLIQRIRFLKASQSWWQAEERRRVFWTVFLMDRFCSVSTGWNLSLTSADVQRRLPCEGALWEKEHEVRTPFFGIADKGGFSSNSPGVSDVPEQEAIGGFAYCIEATESLTLVVNFFLQHALDLQDGPKAQLWLMKFKELDLRLVQWKLFLPTKWREASVLNQDGVMDPNLTLAHITHNTAMILLHQSIAYPPTHWKKQNCAVRLPSALSADTCIEAAAEIATTGQQFLQYSSILTNPQFSFCLFIAGRMLLTHSRYTGVPVPDQLGVLIESLLEISRRWAGLNTPTRENLASVFAKRLLNARSHYHSAMISGRTSLDIRQTVYSDSAEKDGLAVDHDTTSSETIQTGPSPNGSLYNALSLAFPPLPLSLQQQFAPLSDPTILDPAGLFAKDPQESLYPSQPVDAFLHTQHLWSPVSQSHSTCNSDPSFGYLSRYVDSGPSPGQRIGRHGEQPALDAGGIGNAANMQLDCAELHHT